MGSFEGRTVFVTGAGIGIGYAICRSFAGSGAIVALNDIDPAVAAEAAAAINLEIGAEQVFPYPFDVADAAAVRRHVADFAGSHGHLDIMVANAGITVYGPFIDYTVEAFDRLTAVNLRGTFFTAQAAAQQMIALNQPAGRIILMASVTGVQALPNLSAYGSSKAAISHLASVLALELGHHSITVNAIAPGATLTERNLADDADYEAHWGVVTPTGRLSFVQDIAETARFLGSDEARQINGQTIIVDGGWTKRSPMPVGFPEIKKEA